ncbi:MAG: tetratricopeptide repeat protein [Planctomycetes bacterium]|nr:tetratricopeptide repeat protein [Planctomycetota bacterium]
MRAAGSRRSLPSRSAAGLAAALGAALGLAACEGRRQEGAAGPVPEIPRPDVSPLESLVRAQIEAATRACDAVPGDAGPAGRLGMLFQAYGWPEQARACYERAAALDRRDPRWRYLLGRILADLGRPAEAAAAVEEAIRLRPDDLPAHLFLAEQALQEGRVEAARARFKRARALAPSSPHALAGLGQVLLRSGEARRAAALFEEALKASPRFGRALYGLAMAHRALGEREVSDELLARHASSDKGSSPPDPLLDEVEALRLDADHVFRRANEAFKDGRYEGAIELYHEALERSPRLAMAEYDLGLALQKLGRDAEAAGHYEAFLRAEPRALDGHNNLGLCHLNLGRPEEAVRCFERALAIDPAYPKTRYNLALALDRQGKAAEALPHYLEVLEARPDDERVEERLLRDFRGAGGDEGLARRRLAAQLKARGRHEAAVHALRHGLRASPGDWRTAVALAWILATSPDPRLRDPGEAVRLAEPPCRGPAADDPQALDVLAAAYAAQGRFGEAARTAERALELVRRSGDAEAARKLEAGIRSRLERYGRSEAHREE